MLDVIQLILIAILASFMVYKSYPAIQKRSGKGKVILLDSCAVIDGRIIELAKAGFLPGRLMVPEFIIAELQLLADGNDSHKRERARFGLEVIRQLQNDPDVSLQVEHQLVTANTTDDKLVKLAQKINAELFTTDFNLNQVASIEGVRVLNVNELAHALRPVALPGDSFEVKVVQVGQNRDQGVGYLEDGTMIVIDNARKDIGKKVRVHVTRSHQTVAGKMLFAQRVDATPAARQQSKAVQLESNYRKTPSPQKSSHYRQPANNTRVTPGEKSLFKAIDES
jgi:uncharacterized protein YacL